MPSTQLVGFFFVERAAGLIFFSTVVVLKASGPRDHAGYGNETWSPTKTEENVGGDGESDGAEDA